MALTVVVMNLQGIYELCQVVFCFDDAVYIFMSVILIYCVHVCMVSSDIFIMAL